MKELFPNHKRFIRLTALIAGLFVVYFVSPGMFSAAHRRSFVGRWLESYEVAAQQPTGDKGYYERLAAAAVEQTKTKVIYDPAYVTIPYPNGDVPPDRGVCADVIIRAYRTLGSDLQMLIHEDMKKNFALYPKIWGLRAPDTNIDHRRVPNMMTFFKRRGAAIPISSNPKDYQTGDMIAWDLGAGVTHIGFVVWTDPTLSRPYIAHNIGAGPQLEDVIFNWKIIGAFRYRP